MPDLLALATVAAVHLMAAISPGQSFLLVSRVALTSGRRPALAAAFGMGVGATLWAAGAMLGLAILLQQSVLLFNLLKVAGGLYLIYLAVLIWRHARDPLPVATGDVHRGVELDAIGAFRDAVLTQIANPKVAVFFGSIFVALLPANSDALTKLLVLTIVLVDETLWYALVAHLFSAAGPRDVYVRAKPAIDRAMAGVLGLVGARLVADVR